MRPSVSLCMIVKDEALRLETCLQSAFEVVQEIVIVDTGSTDDTFLIASRFGAKVSTFDFRKPDFSGARNQSLAHASGDWILVLDADETLTATSPAVIRALTSQGGNAGYVVSRRNLRYPPGAELTDYAVRLFSNHPRHRYRGRVHETIDATILENGGRIQTSNVTIEHMAPTNGGQAFEKSRFYLGILEEELAANPDDLDRLNFRRAELHKLGLMDEATRTAERIAALAPNDPTNHLNVGLYRLHRHDTVGAERAFRKALALKPHDEQTLAFLESLCRTQR